MKKMSAFKWIFLLIGLLSTFIAGHTAIFLWDIIWLAYAAGALAIVSFTTYKVAP